MECIYNCAAEAAGIDWPAWVQAVGSVGAIIFAVLVPRWHRKADKLEREKRDALEAVALAAIVMRELEEFRSRVNRELSKARRAGPHSIIEIETDKKTIPQALWDTALQLPKLGATGQSTLKAMYSVHRARDYAGRDNTVVREDIRSYIVLMERAKEHCEAAITGVRQILD